MTDRRDGPGILWQCLELFFGMTWPGPKEKAEDNAPLCAACHNRTHRQGETWVCPHHPDADLLSTS